MLFILIILYWNILEFFNIAVIVKTFLGKQFSSVLRSKVDFVKKCYVVDTYEDQTWEIIYMFDADYRIWKKNDREINVL